LTLLIDIDIVGFCYQEATMTRGQMESLTRGLPSKSAKIRRLADAGVATADIARFLGIKYQFAYNVLGSYQSKQQDDQVAGNERVGAEGGPSSIQVTVGPGGTVTLPPALRGRLGVADGDTLIAIAGDGEVALMSVPAAVRKVQTMVRDHVPAGVSLVDELLKERREEVARERRDG
jgi:bifunctional DNA-binding transcriptional regulator/antitoxin component of YhaV-PrlF toxin-antitoxin module